MKTKVIIGKAVRTGEMTAYGSASEAATAVGVTRQSVSAAIKTGGVCAGRRWKYVPRIYAAKTRGGRLMLCGWSQALGGFHEINDKGAKVTVDVYKDISIAFYEDEGKVYI